MDFKNKKIYRISKYKLSWKYIYIACLFYLLEKVDKLFM